MSSRRYLAAAADGMLDRSAPIQASPRVGVVLASRGYPASAATGLPIAGLDEAASMDDVLVFHSGTTAAPVTTGCGRADGTAPVRPAERILTAGGRVLTVVGPAAITIKTAIERAYAAVAKISFDGMQYRRDIGRKATRHA